MRLLDLMFGAPLMAVLKRWPNCVHAVEMGAIVEGFERGTFKTVCGRPGARLVASNSGDRLVAALWPPRVRGAGAMPAHRTRCQTCHEQTGRMRPRTDWGAA